MPPTMTNEEKLFTTYRHTPEKLCQVINKDVSEQEYIPWESEFIYKLQQMYK
jgi:hypothetical protein